MRMVENGLASDIHVDRLGHLLGDVLINGRERGGREGERG